MKTIGHIDVETFAHPQGCRGYLVVDRASKEALALDVHLDYVEDMATKVKEQDWKLRYVVDTHTHADHPSGSGALAAQFGCARVAHEKAQHVGVTIDAKDGEQLTLGKSKATLRHAHGHTPDHMALVIDGALFSGDSLFINGVARTDFLGGDAGVLFDTIHSLLKGVPDDTVLFPGHDYERRTESTIGDEKRQNAWLKMIDRAAFVKALIANPPPRPANMDDLLRLNREGVAIPATISAAEAAKIAASGGGTSVIDVRTGAEYENEHIPGARLIPVDHIEACADEVRATPAPRLLMCQSGNRAVTARKALEKLHVAGLSVVAGGMGAYVQVGGLTVKGQPHMSLERQVRIVAGVMVLCGMILGVFVHRGFLGISAFVGAGLLFAGITNWCGMAMVLAKMPWNHVSSASDTPAAGGTCAASAPGTCAAGEPPPADITPSQPSWKKK